MGNIDLKFVGIENPMSGLKLAYDLETKKVHVVANSMPSKVKIFIESTFGDLSQFQDFMGRDIHEAPDIPNLLCVDTLVQETQDDFMRETFEHWRTLAVRMAKNAIARYEAQKEAEEND